MTSTKGTKRATSGSKALLSPERKGVSEEDIVIRADIAIGASGSDRLSFDGYKLRWHGSSSAEWVAFSGQPDESKDESVKEIGPTPQGLFTIDPANIQKLQPSPDWGSFRVRLDPQKATVERMANCFGVIRTGMYIHGGQITGTRGCIELNNDSDEAAFFAKLAAYGKPIDLEVKYAGAREKKYECPKCPY